jgi:hypothetical protein
MRAESGGNGSAPKTFAPEPGLGDFSRFARYSERLELCAADGGCARFPNRMYVADNAAVLDEAHEP